jgi:hypothetical protein
LKGRELKRRGGRWKRRGGKGEEKRRGKGRKDGE